ncbi:hypothetical protein [Streptomyces sp. NPDC127197]|uniref:hypothetical protein n=1 Tax=Streptomyces sp. NPDC127197 TaxID=3345388 RepID=UPI00362F07DE
MSQRTSGSRARARTTSTPLIPSDLSIRVLLIHGETNASYLSRTATANGLEFPRLPKTLHTGRLPRSAADVHPARQEVMVSTEAMARLTRLVERDQEQLRRALPGLRAETMLDLDRAAVRVTAWPRSRAPDR